MNLDDETLLSAYLDGELDPGLRLKLESELLSDPALAEQLRGLAAVRDLVSGLSRPGLSGLDLSQSVVTALQCRPGRLESPPLRRARLPRARMLVEIASAAAIFLAFSVILRLTLLQLPPRPDHLPVVHVRPSPAIPRNERAVDRKAIEQRPVSKVSPSRALHSESFTAQPVVASRDRSEQTHERDERERRWIRDQLDSQDAIPVFLVNVIGANAADRVDALVKSTSRGESSYGRIQIGKGLVFDPTHPTEATVFTLVLDDRQRKRLREDLNREFPDAIEETSADPTLVTQLADVGQIAVLTTPRGSLAADFIPAPDSPSRRRAIMTLPADKPEVGIVIPDEFEDHNVRVVRELQPPHRGQEEPTPEQERSGPHPSTRSLVDAQAPASPGGRLEPREDAGPVRPDAKASDDRRPASIVLVWVARR